MAQSIVATLDNGEARCQTTTESGRQCKLAVHPDGVSHKYVDRSKTHKSLAEVMPSGFSLTASEVKATDVIKKESNRTDTKPRDADQRKVDKDAGANYAKNKKLGSNTKTDFAKVALSEYIVPPRAVDTVLDYLRRSTGTGGTAKGAQLRYRKGTHASGNVRVQWAILDKASE